MEKQYIIFWKSKLTGTEGHGQTLWTWADASKECDRLNSEFPELRHWPAISSAHSAAARAAGIGPKE